MNRRRLLAGVTTAAVAATAGCGYAYGGGDVRGTATIGGSGTSTAFGGTTAFATTEDRIVRAESGSSPFSGENTSVVVADREATVRWRFDHDATTRGVAVSPSADRVYLVEEGDDGDAGAVAAAARPEADDQGDREREDPSWRAAVEAVAPPTEMARAVPVAADDHGAYVATQDGVAVVRDGDVVRTVETATPVRRLWGGTTHDPEDGSAGGVIAAVDEALVRIDGDGERIWTQDVGEVPAATVAGGRVVVHEGDDLVALDRETGTVDWRVEVGGRTGRRIAPPTVTGDRVAVVAAGAIQVLDDTTGEEAWRASGRPWSPVVVDAGSAYFVDDEVAVAVGPGGTRWTRTLDVEESRVVDAWFDGVTVAFCFASGEVVRLQREDQDRGLL